MESTYQAHLERCKHDMTLFTNLFGRQFEGFITRSDALRSINTALRLRHRTPPAAAR